MGRPATRLAAVIIAAALVATASLGLLVRHRLTASPAVAAAGTEVTMDGLTVRVQKAGWVPMDHVNDGQGGFVMPDEMMPGAPRGEEIRLGVGLTLANTHGSAREFTLVEEFTLAGGGQPQPRALSADTIGDLSRLGPGAAVDATLYFDIPVPDDAESPLYLQWTRAGETVRMIVGLDGDEPEHDH